jgi:hypothetical protein
MKYATDPPGTGSYIKNSLIKGGHMGMLDNMSDNAKDIDIDTIREYADQHNLTFDEAKERLTGDSQSE